VNILPKVGIPFSTTYGLICTGKCEQTTIRLCQTGAQGKAVTVIYPVELYLYWLLAHRGTEVDKFDLLDSIPV
jgi:hypothetical protein